MSLTCLLIFYMMINTHTNSERVSSINKHVSNYVTIRRKNKEEELLDRTISPNRLETQIKIEN